jgi:hypothetical protein
MHYLRTTGIRPVAIDITGIVTLNPVDASRSTGSGDGLLRRCPDSTASDNSQAKYCERFIDEMHA